MNSRLQEMEGGEGLYVRSKDECVSVLKHAKIDESDIKSLTQVMYFAETSDGNDRYILMELNSDLLNILEEGQSLTFRGLKDDGAVLCSKERTFEVKEAETSNSLLLLPSLKWSQEADGLNERTLQKQEVVGVFYKYLELQPCVPQLHRMRDLLGQNQYCGPELVDPDTDSSSTYSFHQLLQLVQASETELRTALKEEMACCINGKWRILSYDYHFRVLSLILGVIDENSWLFDAIDKDEMFFLLTEHVPEEILSSCFSWYMEPVRKSDEGKILYQIQEGKVSRFLAEMLLHDGRRFKLIDFMTTWQATLPEGMKASLSYLEGLAIIKKSSDAEFIEYFPETSLPINISERFSILFQTQEKWTYDEMCPYIKRLSRGKIDVGALLTKYARTSKQNGVKCYTAKHSK